MRLNIVVRRKRNIDFQGFYEDVTGWRGKLGIRFEVKKIKRADECIIYHKWVFIKLHEWTKQTKTNAIALYQSFKNERGHILLLLKGKFSLCYYITEKG